MAGVVAGLEPQMAELSDGAFEAFCEELSSAFGADIQCRREYAGMEPVASLRKRFKKLAAVHVVQATGALNGTFQLLFDQGGLFVLSGVVVMLPEEEILQQVKSGHMDDAENLIDAAREIGNLLVEAWDRVFREECDGHKRFVKRSTHIGKLGENLEQVALSADEEVLLVAYEMTVDSYPTFHCAAVLPKALLGENAGAFSGPVEAAPAEPKSEAQPQEKTEEPTDALSAATPPAAPAAEPVDAVPPQSDVSEQKEEPRVVEDEPEIAEPAASTDAEKAQDKEAVETEAPDSILVRGEPGIVEATEASAAVSASQTESQATPGDTVGILPDERAAALIDQVSEKHAVHPSRADLGDLLHMPVKDIMTKDVVWCDPDDTVQSVIATMQQHNTGYVLVGRDGVLEGLVSNSNILGAISPYLRPTFAKWRRPEDEATLAIKIKWVMSRPVRTVEPDLSLAAAIENMCRHGGRCLPVMDGQGKTQGILTAFDVLSRVLETDGSFSLQDPPPQGPPSIG